MSGPLASRAAVLVPVKPLSEAKSRLAPALAIEDRQALVRAMLADVLAAVRAAHAGPLLVLSPDDAYDGIVDGAGAIARSKTTAWSQKRSSTGLVGKSYP